LGGSTRPGRIRLDASNNKFTGPSEGYAVFYRSMPTFAEYQGGGLGLHDVTASLANGDDRQTLAVNDIAIGSAGYGQQRTFHLGRLGGADAVTFDDTNTTGGYAWGFDLDSDGHNVFHDWQGTAGGVGASGNDQSRPHQVVHQVDVHPSGFRFTRLSPLAPPRVGRVRRPSPVLGSDGGPQHPR
jgi:hypothetical protein